VLKKESDILRGREPDVGGDPVFFLQYQREQQHTNIALMLWITMEVAEGKLHGDVVYSGVRESIRGGGARRDNSDHVQAKSRANSTTKTGGTYDVVYTGVRL
jgi:hypothetical protein